MSSKKSAKRANQSLGEECKAKVACRPTNLITLTEGEVEHQTTPTPCSSSHVGGGELKLMFAPQRYLAFSRFQGQDLIHVREYAVKTA